MVLRIVGVPESGEHEEVHAAAAQQQQASPAAGSLDWRARSVRRRPLVACVRVRGDRGIL
jgi:hypothetical protein